MVQQPEGGSMNEVDAMPISSGLQSPETDPAGGHGIAFGEAVRVWVRIAALSFGGPAGQIAVMHRILVDEKKRSEEHTSELQSLMRISYAVFCLKKQQSQLS